MALVRQVLGEQLRRRRLAQARTLRDVSRDARVSLGYLSEVERGRKEPSSELLGAICEALDAPLSAVLRDVSDDLALHELLAVGATVRPIGHRVAAAAGAVAAVGRGAAPAPVVVPVAVPDGETRPESVPAAVPEMLAEASDPRVVVDLAA